jgi:hypothetical protein
MGCLRLASRLTGIRGGTPFGGGSGAGDARGGADMAVNWLIARVLVELCVVIEECVDVNCGFDRFLEGKKD